MAGAQGGAADDGVARAERHLVDAAVRGRARLAEAGLHAGQVLQFQDDVFEDVAGPGAVAQALDEAAALAHAAAVLDEAGQPGVQAFVQAGQGVGRTFFEFAEIEPGFDDRAVSPDIGSTQVGYTKNCDVFLFRHEKISGHPADARAPCGIALCLYAVSPQWPGARAAALSFAAPHMLYTCRNEAYRAEPISASPAPPIEYRTPALRPDPCMSTASASTAFHRHDLSSARRFYPSPAVDPDHLISMEAWPQGSST